MLILLAMPTCNCVATLTDTTIRYEQGGAACIIVHVIAYCGLTY